MDAFVFLQLQKGLTERKRKPKILCDKDLFVSPSLHFLLGSPQTPSSALALHSPLTLISGCSHLPNLRAQSAKIIEKMIANRSTQASASTG
jgi:hypothetical protein